MTTISTTSTAAQPSTTILPRIGAVSGAVFAIVLFVAAGDGSQTFNAARAAAGMAAITCAVPFLAYLFHVLHEAEGPRGWLAGAALSTGVTGIAIKLASGVPDLAAQQAHVSDGTPVRAVLDAMGGAATLTSLYPLAMFCAATGVVAIRFRALPRWLGIGAFITAIALAVNGAFVGTESVPGLLVFIVWTLLTSIHLLRTSHSSSG